MTKEITPAEQKHRKKLLKMIEQNPLSIKALKDPDILSEVNELQDKIDTYPPFSILEALDFIADGTEPIDPLNSLIEVYEEADPDTQKAIKNTLLLKVHNNRLYKMDIYEKYQAKRAIYEDPEAEDPKEAEDPEAEDPQKELQEKSPEVIVFVDSLLKYQAKSINQILEYTRNRLKHSEMSHYIKLNTISEIQETAKNFSLLKDYRDIILKEHIKDPQDPQDLIQDLIQEHAQNDEVNEVINAIKMINPVGIDTKTINRMTEQEINKMIKEASKEDFLLPQRIQAIIKTNKTHKKLQETLTPKETLTPLTETQENNINEQEIQFIQETIKDKIPVLIQEHLQMKGLTEYEKYGETITENINVEYHHSLDNETKYTPNQILEMFDTTGQEAQKFIEKIKRLTGIDYYQHLKSEVNEATKKGNLLPFLREQTPITLHLISISQKDN